MPAFHLVNTSKGLNDGVIQSIAQDKYGYIWIGTVSGLNRFDGYTIKQFVHQSGDSTTILPGKIISMCCNNSGDLFIGCETGIVQYDYTTASFKRINSRKDFVALKMIPYKNKVIAATSLGLAIIDNKTKNLSFLSEQLNDSTAKKILKYSLFDMAVSPDGNIVGCSSRGIVIYNPANNHVVLKSSRGLSSSFFKSIEVKPDGSAWVVMMHEPKLIRMTKELEVEKVFDYLFPGKATVLNGISDILLDKKQRLWVSTVTDGLCLYENEKFTSFINSPFQASSPVANHLTTLFQDRDGLIWVGSEGNGVNYFNPDKNRFQTLLPGANTATAGGWMWGRAASEDSQGNLWLATLDGVFLYEKNTGKFKNWQNTDRKNQIYSNSIRGVLADGDKVWFGTGNGVNLYDTNTGRIDFLDKQDSLPPGFYFTIYKDSRNQIWIGTRDHGGLFYSIDGKKFHSINYHPVLKNIDGGVRSIYEDRKKRMWFGLNEGGLVMYDVSKQTIKKWTSNPKDNSTLPGNLITGITEDNNGKIWVSSNSGIASLDVSKDKFVQYRLSSGLPSERSACIRADDRNRIWAGTAMGLVMLDQEKNKWQQFNEHDGLTTLEFGDMPSSQLSDGKFVFPSLKGFLVFNPLEFDEEQKQIPVLISSTKVLNKDLSNNPEEFAKLSLRHNQNFFTLTLTALNYENPAQVWYAYKLEGFDQDWIFTKDRSVNYTNVPGGNYKFLYKATTNINNWNVPVKTLLLDVGTVFYNTVIFWSIIAVLLVTVLYFIYKFRMNKQRQILLLETKTRELEKEKTVVQYEGLKQQLNPHFLFNSLTSLRSLIKTNTKTATEFVDGLSKVYRYVLRSGEHELTTVKDELDFVAIFIKLQKTRFGQGLEVCVHVEEHWYGKYIVPVTLQGLVENAIKHNTADTESPLKLCIYSEEGYVVVRNNLQRYHVVESSNRKGLESLRRLYSFYTEKPILLMEDDEYFTVKIPLL